MPLSKLNLGTKDPIFIPGVSLVPEGIGSGLLQSMMAQLQPLPGAPLGMAEGGTVEVDPDIAEYEALVASAPDDPSIPTFEQFKARKAATRPPVVQQEQGASGVSEASPGAAMVQAPPPVIAPMQPDEGDYSFMQAPYERERAAQIAQAYDDPSNAIAPLPSSYEDMRRLQAMGMVDEQGRQTDKPSPAMQALTNKWLPKEVSTSGVSFQSPLEAYGAAQENIRSGVGDPIRGAIPGRAGRILGTASEVALDPLTIATAPIGAAAAPIRSALAYGLGSLGAGVGQEYGGTTGAFAGGLAGGVAPFLAPAVGRGLQSAGQSYARGALGEGAGAVPEGAVQRTVAPATEVRPGFSASPTEGFGVTSPVAGGAPKKGEMPVFESVGIDQGKVIRTPQPTARALDIPNDQGIETFIYRAPKEQDKFRTWHVVERQSGYSIAGAATEAEAIEMATTSLTRPGGAQNIAELRDLAIKQTASRAAAARTHIRHQPFSLLDQFDRMDATRTN